MMWSDKSIDWCASVPKLFFFFGNHQSHGVLSFIGFENLFAIYMKTLLMNIMLVDFHHVLLF